MSFYGYFGHWKTASPGWAYLLAGGLALFAVLLTGATLVTAWKTLPVEARAMLLLAPAVMVLNVLGSALHSWTVDYQPQGRYVFASLVPLALLAGGTWAFDTRWLRVARAAGWAILCALCLYLLWYVAPG